MTNRTRFGPFCSFGWGGFREEGGECSSLKRFFQLLPAWVLAQAGLAGPWLPGRSPALLSAGGRRDLRNLRSCTVRRPEPLEAHPAHSGARAAQRPERSPTVKEQQESELLFKAVCLAEEFQHFR
ncbi:Serine/Threonine-Protein Kinase Pak 6 [Manis pentadactyla]|nr:Serine/Threonine-Protein Kinase Pak 6 [Manis pentadactyla]